eukprot:COSAG04_NODE_816_length_10084_cov_4.719179_6_plen_80_part_00
MIDAVFAQKDRAEWEEIFKAQDVWHQPVLSAAVSPTACKSASHEHVFCASLASIVTPAEMSMRDGWVVTPMPGLPASFA